MKLLNLPSILLGAYSAYFVYLIQTGIVITLPYAIFFGFLVFLYGFQLYMDHIKKPDPNVVLEEKLEIEFKKLNEEILKVNRRVDSYDIAEQFKSVTQKTVGKKW